MAAKIRASQHINSHTLRSLNEVRCAALQRTEDRTSEIKNTLQSGVTKEQFDQLQHELREGKKVIEMLKAQLAEATASIPEPVEPPPPPKRVYKKKNPGAGSLDQSGFNEQSQSRLPAFTIR
jgi:hypothetical protein